MRAVDAVQLVQELQCDLASPKVPEVERHERIFSKDGIWQRGASLLDLIKTQGK